MKDLIFYMDSSGGSLWVILIILIILSGYFSASETAFTAFNRASMKNMAQNGNKKAALVLKLSENFDKLISTLLIGNNIVNITMTLALGHTWGEWTVTVPAGYTKNGVESRICHVCGEVETREIPHLVSEYDYVINSIEANSIDDSCKTISVSVTKASVRKTSALMIIAVYENGTLTDVVTTDISDLSADETEIYKGKISATDGSRIKVFVWNSLIGMDALSLPMQMQ